jgi:hypothetical protein
MEASMVSEPTAGPDTPPTSKGEAKFINLTLQGGGAHGAFTWGSSTACSRRTASGLMVSAQRAPAQ